MNNRKKISIIIPAYNAERRIENCLNSIIQQKNNNIEIILINDGSTDNTLEIINNYDYAKTKHIIINKENEGVSKARNEGIKAATGEYILFLDSDDTLTPNIIFKIFEKFKRNVDVIKVSYCLEYKNKTVSIKEKLSEKIIEKKDIDNFILDLIIGKTNGFSSLFIMKRDILLNNKIKYPENIKYMEDLIFVIKMLEKANSILITNEILLNYYQSDSSISKSIDILKRIEGIDNRYNYCINYFNNEENLKYKEKFINMVINLYIKTEKYIYLDKTDIKNYNMIIYNRISDILSKNKVKIDLKNKIMIFLIKYKFSFIILLLIKFYQIQNFVKGVKNND